MKTDNREPGSFTAFLSPGMTAAEVAAKINLHICRNLVLDSCGPVPGQRIWGLRFKQPPKVRKAAKK